MKTNIKKTMTTLAVLATISFSTMVKADEALTLPVIAKPTILQEGTQRVLTQAQIEDLLPWAKNSKLFLTDLLDNIQGLTSQDKIDRLVEGIKNVVGDSAPKNSELLMRYSLNRGLVINDILSQEMGADVVGTQDVKLRVLISSINMAIKYYDTDMDTLSKKTPAPFVVYGLDYFSFLSELNKSIFDASAQYSIQRTALEWLQWDLYRDLNNTSYAAQIVKINNSLKTFPTKKMSDAQAIANIRLMKKTAQQLNVVGTLNKILEDQRISAAKSEEERTRIQEDIQRQAKRNAGRTNIDAEKIKLGMAKLNDSDWSERRNAVRQLSDVVGADVTMKFVMVFLKDSDNDVINEALTALNKRLYNADYTLKGESFDNLNAAVLLAFSTNKISDWSLRRKAVYLIGKIETLETYKLLSSWAAVESDSDVKVALAETMKALESKIK